MRRSPRPSPIPASALHRGRGTGPPAESHGRDVCAYFGTRPAGGLPIGPWAHWMHVQATNIAPPGTDPLDAAQIIGGLPVSDHYRSTLDVACGPFVFDDDGTFDIELLSV